MSATPQSSSPALDTFRDIILWRRKKLSATVILVSTATWVLLEVYQFKFITVASWLAIFIAALLFLSENLLRLLGKEPRNLSALEISEQTSLEITNTCRTLIEEALRWMFHVTVEADWFVFARTVAGLLLLSYVGRFFDLLILIYIGVMMLMTVPVIYVKYGDQIKRSGERIKAKSRRFHEMFDEKVIRKMKNKINVKQEKEKKVEYSRNRNQLIIEIRVRNTAKRFEPVLNHLNDTVNWITPRIREISRWRDSDQETERLLILLKQAKETVDQCSGVSSWNYYKKYKFAKRLIEIDDSIRQTLQVFFPVMILEDTRRISDSVDELKLMLLIFFYTMLDDFHSSAKNTGSVLFDLIRSKVSFENLGLDKIAKSKPAEIANDIALWKRKKLSGSLLFTSTATWLLQQVYEYNFLTIASWVVIFIVTSFFVWRKVKREEATKSRLENIRKQVTMEIANACWEVTDKVIRWIFQVTDAEREWFVFPQTVALLLIFSYVGSFFDLPTLCKGVMMGTTIPAMVAKHGDRIKPFGRNMGGRVYEMVEEMLMNTEEMMKKNNKIKKQN